MPQLLLLGLIAVGVVLIYRMVKREMTRVDNEINRKKNVKADPGEPLVYDKESGKYRPKSDS